MAQKKATYFTYDEGISCKNLHLGNLVHDFKNPSELEPFVCQGFVEYVISIIYLPFPSFRYPPLALVLTCPNVSFDLGRMIDQ